MAKDMRQLRKERQENKNNETYEDKKTNINWYPGHMAKTKTEIRKNISLIDIVIEVVDSRIPFSSRIKDLKQYTLDKKTIMLFSKYDLCDKKETDKWIEKYKSEGNIVLSASLKEENIKAKLIPIIEKETEQINVSRKNKGLLPRKIKVLVVGVPNTGKSTLINKLVGRNIAGVGNKPGVTRNLSWIKVNDKIDLLDSPGILWPKIDNQEIALNLASFTSIKEEILPIENVAIHILKKLNQNYQSILKQNYGIDNFDINDIEKAYIDIAKNKNISFKNDEHYDRINLLIINDIKQEKIKEITFDKM